MKTNDASALVELQETDLIILRSKKHLDEMPEREKILTLRSKLSEVDTKAAQVAKMRTKCDAEIKRFQDEDSMLKAKADEIQGKIKESADYRMISSLTRDLEGTMKRREKIDFEFGSLTEHSDKISAVEKQISDARAVLVAQEESLVASFKSNGTALQKEIALAQRRRAELVSELPEDLLARYEKYRKARGGIGVAVLKGRRCSICRTEYHEGQYAQVVQGEDFGECPACHRLLIVRGLGLGPDSEGLD